MSIFQRSTINILQIKKCRPLSTDGTTLFRKLLLRMTGSGRCRLRRLTILHTTFITQFTAFGSLLLAFRRFAVLVGFFLHEASGFLDLTFDAHLVLSNLLAIVCKRP